MISSVLMEMTGRGVPAASWRPGGVPLRIWGGSAEAAAGAIALVWALTRVIHRPSVPSTARRWRFWPGPPTRPFAVAAGALGLSVIVWGVGEALPGRPGHTVQLIAVAMTVLAGVGAAVTFPAEPSEPSEDAYLASTIALDPVPEIDDVLVDAEMFGADSVGLELTAG